MPQRFSPRRTAGRRLRPILLGGVLLAVLTAALIVLPVFLLSGVESVTLPPPPSELLASRSRPDDAWSAEPDGGRDDEDDGSEATADGREAEPADQRPPIIERRRVGGGGSLPAARTDQAAATPPAAEFDRSDRTRRERVRRFGGSERTENAVEAGLNWLAAHQMPDGSWDRFGFDRQCPAGTPPCPGRALNRTKSNLKPGITGLALLAFLGAGYTDAHGPHQAVVANAVQALLVMQAPNGGFGADGSMAGYNDSVATFALAEYFALTRDERVRAALRRAVARLVASQQELGGWDYLPNPATGRNDTSITAWAVQALQACAAGGIDVPPATLIDAALHFTRAAEPEGRVWYADAGTGFAIDPETLRPVYRYGPAMAAAGMACEALLGWRSESPVRLDQRARLFGELPSVALAQKRGGFQLHGYYYWYYGTIAMFQVGGESWQRWNAALRDAILPLQDRSKTGDRKRHSYGSWPPFGPGWGKWGRMGGRVYSTAICTLTLEIYYRHTPAYLDDRLTIRAEDWQGYLRHADPRQRRLAVRCLAETRVEVGEPVLIDLLDDADASVALAAAEALLAVDSPVGRAVIEQAAVEVPVSRRSVLQRLLRRARDLEGLPPARGRVRIFDEPRGLATIELPRAYVGMRASIERNGRTVAEMRVVQRFTGRRVVLAQLVGQPTDTPRTGDAVVAK